jgi:hypothetical protein
MEMDFDMDSEESPIDLTGASDEEILKVFKAMGEDDGIIVKKDGENVHLSDENSDVEYLVKLGESEEDELMEDEMTYEETDESVDDVINAIFSGDMEDVDSSDIDFEDDEVVYEIELDEDDEMMEAVSLKAAPKPVTSEEGSVNKKSTVAANAGAKGPIGNAVKPVHTTGAEAKGRPAPTTKDLIGKVGNSPAQGTQKPSPATKPHTAQATGVNTKSVVPSSHN